MLDNLTKKYYKDDVFMNKLKHSLSISEAIPKEYDVIYFTGGQGVMFNFPDNQYIQNAINKVYKRGGIVSVACHGIADLLNAKNDNGRYLIDNKQITGFSNSEEVLANYNKIVPFMLENEIKKREAYYSKAKSPFTPYVKVDQRVVTGQNPQSPKKVAQAVDKLINKRLNFKMAK